MLGKISPYTSRAGSLKVYPLTPHDTLWRIDCRSFIFEKKGVWDHCSTNFATMIKGSRIGIKFTKIDGS